MATNSTVPSFPLLPCRRSNLFRQIQSVTYLQFLTITPINVVNKMIGEMVYPIIPINNPSPVNCIEGLYTWNKIGTLSKRAAMNLIRLSVFEFISIIVA